MFQLNGTKLLVSTVWWLLPFWDEFTCLSSPLVDTRVPYVPKYLGKYGSGNLQIKFRSFFGRDRTLRVHSLKNTQLYVKLKASKGL